MINANIFDFPHSFPLWKSQPPIIIDDLIKILALKLPFLPLGKTGESSQKTKTYLLSLGLHLGLWDTYIPNNFHYLRWCIAKFSRD